MRRPLAMVCLVCILAIWLGMLFFPDKEFPGEEIKNLDDSNVRLVGTVYKKEEQLSDNQKVLLLYLKEVSAYKAETSVITFSKNNRVICYVEHNITEKMPKIGEVVKAEGKFLLYSGATNPGQFDSKGYYRTLGICGKLISATVLEKAGKPKEVEERLYQLRENFAGQIEQLYEEKEAGIMKALLLGQKSGMDEELEDSYKRNGIIHIVSISGLHITCIGISIYMMLRKLGLPTWLAGVIAGGTVILYGIMIGQPTSAYRAIVMFLLKILADMIGRTYDMLTALSVAALLLVLQQPLYLKNAGFLLSFGCVLGIILIYPVFVNLSNKKNDLDKEKSIVGKLFKKTKEGMYAGSSILLITLPIQLSFYYEYPLISMIWNLLVVSTVGSILQVGIIQLIWNSLFGNVPEILSIFICFFLRLYEGICKAGDMLPFQKVILGCPTEMQIFLYYVFVAVGIWILKYGKKRWKLKNNKCAIGILGLAIAILLVRPMNGIRITFADVGQGDCILMQSKTGEASIFDCGSSSQTKCGEYILTPMVKYFGIDRINGIYVSHPDSDHMNGILEFVERSKTEKISIEKIVIPYPVNDDMEDGFEDLVRLAKDMDIPVYYIGQGMNIAESKMEIECIYPRKCESAEGTNDASAVYLLRYRDFSVLLTGDVEKTGEMKIVKVLKERGIGNIDVLKVAHHGSRYSSTAEFLKQVNPRVAVISCGDGNSYGHPHEETLERLSNVGSTILTTPKCGAIMVEIDKEIKLRSFIE